MSDNENTQDEGGAAEAPKVEGDLASQIMAGVDAKVAAQSEESGDDGESDEAAGAVEPEGEAGQVEDDPAPAAQGDEEQEGDDGGDPYAGLSNSSLERAIRCGIPLEEAKQYPNDALLIAACDRIEGASGGTSSKQGAGEGESEAGDGQSEDDPLSAIPDLSRDEYDDELVDVFDGMKGIIRKLMNDNAELRKGQSSDWFGTKLEGVKDLTKGDPDKVSALRAKFDVLKAGYDAAGQDVPDESVFSEASKLVLGDEMLAAERQKKSNAARRRNGQFMSRAESRRVTPKGDPMTEVAAMLDSKFSS